MKQDSGRLFCLVCQSGKTTCGRWLSDKYKIHMDYDGVIQPFMTEVYDRFIREEHTMNFVLSGVVLL
ncbi:MAG: hypothetical protein ACLUOI_31485 [Eisenbergiella sp.]